jgi:hypothetical protein
MESLEFDIQRVSDIDCQNIPDHITLYSGYSEGVNCFLASHIVCIICGEKRFYYKNFCR